MSVEVIFVFVFILIIFVSALMKSTDILSTFVEGAKEGLTTVVKILPPLALMLTAIGMMKASGILDLIVFVLKTPASALDIPSQALPIAVLRPFSGSGAIAMFEKIISEYGVDSRIGELSAILCASTETTFYTISVYLGDIGGKCGKIIVCAIISDIAVVLLSCIVV